MSRGRLVLHPQLIAAGAAACPYRGGGAEGAGQGQGAQRSGSRRCPRARRALSANAERRDGMAWVKSVVVAVEQGRADPAV